MHSLFKVVAAGVLIATFVGATFFVLCFIEQETNSAKAVQAEAKVNILAPGGSFEFSQARAEQTAADSAAGLYGAALAASAMLFLLAAIVWLLADANQPAAVSATAVTPVSS